MSKLKNNFTTPEQSKRLLELGVPADSADCYYTAYGLISVIMPNINDTSFICEVGCTPCWSVGRLIEILTICNHFGSCTIDWISFCEEQSSLQTIYDELCAGVTQGLLDFSKLEE